MDQDRLKAIIRNAIDGLNITLDKEKGSSSKEKIEAINEIKGFLETFYTKNGELRYCTSKMVESLRDFLNNYKGEKYKYIKDVFCIPLAYSKESKMINNFLDENIAMLDDILNSEHSQQKHIAKSMSNTKYSSLFNKIKLLNAEFEWLDELEEKKIPIPSSMLDELSSELKNTFKEYGDTNKITDRDTLSSYINTAEDTLRAIIARLPKSQTTQVTENFTKSVAAFTSQTKTFIGKLLKHDSASIDSAVSTIRSEKSQTNADTTSEKSRNTIISNISNLTEIEEPNNGNIDEIRSTLEAYLKQLNNIKNNVDNNDGFENVINNLKQIETGAINIINPLLSDEKSDIIFTKAPEDDASEELHKQFQLLNDAGQIRENLSILSPLAKLMHNVNQFELDPYKDKNVKKPS